MSMLKRPRPDTRIHSVAAACARVAVGPFQDRSRLDRGAAGAAGGILVLATVGLPVTIASVTPSKTVPSWVLALCIVTGIIGLALIIKSCQRPKAMPVPGSDVLPPQEPTSPDVPRDGSIDTRNVSGNPSGIDVKDSKLTKSGISIPEGSKAAVAGSELLTKI